MEVEKIKRIARKYYSRKDIQKVLFEQAKNREIIPRYVKRDEKMVTKDTILMGKRPDTLEYLGDLIGYVERGATSFHVSEEFWQDPLQLKTALTQQALNKLRLGWDLILDIDCPYLEYSKIAAFLLIEALYFHGIKKVGLKFSGKKGWHIGVPFEAFPKRVQNIDVKGFFPEGPRIIAAYLKDMIKKGLAERMLEMSSLKEISRSMGKPEKDLLDDKNQFNPYSVLEVDTVLISSRHLYRMAYSLHEVSGLSSIVIRPEQLRSFHIGWAKPERVLPKPFLPVPEKEEAKELLIQALDWVARQEQRKTFVKKEKFSPVKTIKIKELKPELYPPCIQNILPGIKKDGRKRALFVLINYFRSLGMEFNDIEKILTDWNKKNYNPLRGGYVKTQLNWFKRQSVKLPPNCKNYYQDLGICFPDSLCNKIKNPVTYVVRKARFSKVRGKKAKK
ncbi:MAG: hypothetical protein JSW08_00940 [archaeon]|nr:MAG: hypothetical protein JSW08_00940 [archaeon]